MKFKKCFSISLLASKLMIEDFTSKCSNRISPSYFTRLGKTGFKETLLFMLNMITKSVQVELNKFIEGIFRKDGSISKQVFSENKQKIHLKVFIDLNDRINKVIYE